MSIFGIMSLTFLLLLFYTREKISLKSNVVALTILHIFQLFFIFRDAFIIFNLGKLHTTFLLFSFIVVIILLLTIVNKLMILRHNKLNVMLIICALIFLIYTEYFNGIYSFKSISEFQSYNMPLKRYYYLLPYKLTKVDQENQARVYYLDFFFATYIKKDNQRNLFYYKTKGIGENGYWFKFGIPEGQQV